MSDAGSALRSIFAALDDKGYTSNPEIASTLKISLPTSIALGKKLIAKGILVKDGKCPSTGGKRSDKLIFNPQYRVLPGLDIRRNEAWLCVLSFDGSPLIQESRALDFAVSDDYARKLCAFVQESMAEISSPVAGKIGISIPGTVNADHSFDSHALKLRGASLGFLEEALKTKLLPVNDSNAGALACASYLPGHSFIYLNLGPTVGAGVISSGRLLEGMHGRAGEAGHVTLYPNGRTCYCGRSGCADPYLNEEALCAGCADLKEFTALLKEGDPKVQRQLDAYLNALALLVSNLYTFCDLPVFLGGTVGPVLTADEKIMEALEAKIEAQSLFSGCKLLVQETPAPQVPLAAFGAACLTRRVLMEELLETEF